MKAGWFSAGPLECSMGCGVGQPTVRPQKKHGTRFLGRYTDEQIGGQGVQAQEISGSALGGGW